MVISANPWSSSSYSIIRKSTHILEGTWRTCQVPQAPSYLTWQVKGPSLTSPGHLGQVFQVLLPSDAQVTSKAVQEVAPIHEKCDLINVTQWLCDQDITTLDCQIIIRNIANIDYYTIFIRLNNFYFILFYFIIYTNRGWTLDLRLPDLWWLKPTNWAIGEVMN